MKYEEKTETTIGLFVQYISIRRHPQNPGDSRDVDPTTDRYVTWHGTGIGSSG